MPEYHFERECRTPTSEAFTIIDDEDNRLGRVDLHFASTVVHGTLCVGESLTAEQVQDLIDLIDEELVLAADVIREDFIITVYQGRELGVFSDQDAGEDRD